MTAQNQINTELRELAGLWVDSTSDSLRRITKLCNEITESVARRGFSEAIDRDLLHRAELLAARAEKRLNECLAIMTRTGSYSTHGDLETSLRVATSGWEG